MNTSEIKNLIREAKKNNDTKLILSSKRLTFLPPEIFELNNLKELNLSCNKLTSLPPEILKLKNLTHLNLSYNKLTSLPSGISKLKNIVELDLSNNQMTFLPFGTSKLENLTKLDIRNNHLVLLPSEILDIQLDINWEAIAGRGIFVGDNPFGYPPVGIIKKGRQAIIDYFNSSQNDFEQLNEVKILFVGEGGVGKTSLVNRLISGIYHEGEIQTQGININELIVENKNQKIKVNLWDFGGQEIMHATHQLFLSKQSLYVLVLDSRKGNKVEYWLKAIQCFGGESPILIVINKIDEDASFDLNRTFLKEKYPSIRGFCRVSCANNDGIKNFSEKLKQELVCVENIKTQWPKSWLTVKKELENTKNEIISYNEYKRVCDKYNIKERSTQDILIHFLVDLGVVIHFKNIPLLDAHIFKPKWITNAIYKIINSHELANQSGVLQFDCLDDVLRKKCETDFYYSQEKYNFIIETMEIFELCCEIDEKMILLPDLLKVQEPDFDFDYKIALKFIIEYDFLPMSLMPRFIVKMHKNIKDDLCWRTGVVLEDKKFNSSAVIKLDNEAKRIYIYASGEQKRDFFSVILFNFREINKSFEKLGVIEKVPMPNEPKIAVSYKHLIKLEELGIHRYIPDGSDFEYDVKDLLGSINEDKNLEKIPKSINIEKSSPLS